MLVDSTLRTDSTKALRKLLDNSGWVAALVQSEIASNGTADSYLKSSCITRT
jgi:hypothetical protein